jgi:hypothetical protein
MSNVGHRTGQMVTALVVKCRLCKRKETFTVRDKTNMRHLAAKAGWLEKHNGWECSCRKVDLSIGEQDE